ncbi:MAG: hypothetical protein LBI82_06805, partial [Dysgonamonadaceae bacterium]|nr:hypothetical protein [Dysgonamonadaceae bacterium]
MKGRKNRRNLLRKAYLGLLAVFLTTSYSANSQDIINQAELLKKGNKVFIEANEATKGYSEKFFIPAMKEWGYWTIVDNIDEAHFIIVFNI